MSITAERGKMCLTVELLTKRRHITPSEQQKKRPGFIPDIGASVSGSSRSQKADSGLPLLLVLVVIAVLSCAHTSVPRRSPRSSSAAEAALPGTPALPAGTGPVPPPAQSSSAPNRPQNILSASADPAQVSVAEAAGAVNGQDEWLSEPPLTAPPASALPVCKRGDSHFRCRPSYIICSLPHISGVDVRI